MLFGACSSNTSTKESVYDLEAEQILDSIRDIDILLEYADKYAKLNEKRAEEIIRENVGKLYRDCSKFENAVMQHDSAIALAKLTNDTLHWIKALNQQGTNFRRMGDMEEASKLHYQALELCDAQISDTSYASKKNRVVTLNGLGNVLLSMANYEEAENMFRQALAGERELNSPLGQAINYANIGSIFEHKNMLDSARTYYNKSMEMNKVADNATGIGLCYHYLGQINEKEGNYDAAQKNYLTSYQISVPTGDSWHWLEASIALSKLYIKTENIDSARKYVDITTKTAEAIHSKEHRATAYLLGSQFEGKWGTLPREYYLFRRWHELSDSVLNEKNYNQMQNLRVNYEAKRRGAEVEQAKSEAKMEQTMRLMITGVGLLILLVMSGITISLIHVNRISNKSNLALQSANEALKQADEELRQADEELRQADRERQAFYRDIAHRFRTPLTVVIGMTQQLREHINKDDEQAQGDFMAVERQNNELLRLVNEMMHRLQPNASTATVTISGGELHVGNLSEDNFTDSEITNADNNEYDNTEAKVNADGTKPLILLAEDNEDVARYQCELLERNGYRVNWAVDGMMALDLIKEEMPKLVITDVMMPKMDGLELCRNIRKNEETNHLPLIVVTARVEDRDRMKGLEAGAEVYLTKPFLGKELLLNIKNLLEQREKLRQKFVDEMPATAVQTVLNTESDSSYIDEDSAKEFQRMVNEVIDNNIADPEFSSTILAAHMCLSRSQLNRRINSELGTDTTHYIRERRLEHACRMLKNGEMTIMDIQIACGFDSPGYFSRVFKQKFDMSPSEFRKATV